MAARRRTAGSSAEPGKPTDDKMTASARKGTFAALNKDTRGSVFVEAALIVPLTVMILAAIAEWGLVLFQFNQLSTGTANAVRTLIISRGYTTPYQDVIDQYTAWTRGFEFGPGKPGTITVTINGTTCTDNASCKTALDTALGKDATIVASYDCIMQFTPRIASLCPLSVRMTGVVE